MTCPCSPEAYPFVCPLLNKRMSPHLVYLCQTRPGYRELWQRRAAGTERPRPDPPLPLRQWLVEQLGRLRESEAKRRHYREPTAALSILAWHCTDCSQYDHQRETCRAVHGCGAVGRYRHSLTTTTGKCPLGTW